MDLTKAIFGDIMQNDVDSIEHALSQLKKFFPKGLEHDETINDRLDQYYLEETLYWWEEECTEQNRYT